MHCAGRIGTTATGAAGRYIHSSGYGWIGSYRWMVLVALCGMDRNNGTTTMHSQRLQQHTAPAYCTAASACNYSRWSQNCGWRSPWWSATPALRYKSL
jgi:hypothetical protein